LYFRAICHEFMSLTLCTVTLIVKDWPGVTVISAGVTDIVVASARERLVQMPSPRIRIVMVARRSFFKRLAYLVSYESIWEI
jgi:hypothetical protein